MQTTIEVKDGSIVITGPYSADNNRVYKSLGGKYSDGSWTLPDSPTSREEVAKLFGTKSEEVDVLVPAKGIYDDEILQIGGYVLASRKARDWRVQLADGVTLVAGKFSSRGGSMKNPRVSAGDDVVFRLRCRKSFAEAHGLEIATAPAAPQIEI